MLDTIRPDAGSNAGPGIAIRIHIPLRLVGFAIIGLVALVLLACASWSVDDPSFSYATAKAPANWLGFPGAAIADFAFQIFGVGIIVLLIPPAVWGWNFVRRRVPEAMGFRLVAWIGATVLATGALTFVAIPQSWPLPTGLGGLIGSGFSALARTVIGEEPQAVTAAIFAMLLAVPTLALFWMALGLKLVPPAKPVKTRAKAAPTGKGRREPVFEAPVEEEPAEREPNPLVGIVLGAATHLGFTVSGAIRRAMQRRKDKLDDVEMWREAAVEPGVETRPAPRTPSAEQPLVADVREFSRRHVPTPHVEPVLEADAPRADANEDFYPEASDDDFLPDALIDVAANRGGPRPIQTTQPTLRVSPPSRPVPAARSELPPVFAPEAGGFELPPLTLMAEPKHGGIPEEHRPERLEAMARKLESVLEDFGVKGDIINVRPGPVVTLFELEPAPGIKSSRVIGLADDIARSMSAISARVAVVPGRNAIGIELPNETRETVYLREMLASADFEKMKGKLPICLGKTIGGEPIVVDLARMPHLLIAGTTGSGKSVGINTMILSLLYRMTPEECRLIMIDPKMLELSIYDGIPHLLTPVVTDPGKAVVALKWAVREMEDRYRKMSKIGVRNIDGFNQRVSEANAKGEIITRTVQTGFDRETGEAIFESEEFNLEPLPYIVIIVDEMADLMMVAGKDIEGAIQRLAQMARAAGIHLVMATQRPSVDVITGTIKANFPTRISFQVTSKIDSRTILGEQGAEQLLGNGDMLYMAGGGRIRRLHGPFVADTEVEDIVAHLKSQGSPDYLDAITVEDDEDGEAGGAEFGMEEDTGTGDELYDKAVHIVLTDKKVSTSYIQRRLAIGYNKAATLIERMEKEGVISRANHAGKREILIGSD
ncbi:MAG: ftsK/SpoIIIE family protein [Devosia sp.]|nr:ftsK/SpoIIIE family protein [Devosia sp.]